MTERVQSTSGLRLAVVDGGAVVDGRAGVGAGAVVDVGEVVDGRAAVGQVVRAGVGDGGRRQGTAWPMLRRSADLLVEAVGISDGVGRFGLARLAAMHAAWAVCRHRAGGGRGPGAGGGRGPGAEGVWALMAETCPALADWQLVFDACDRRWSAVCRGGPAPSTREVDDLLREADDFRRVVSVLLSTPAGGPRSLP